MQALVDAGCDEAAVPPCVDALRRRRQSGAGEINRLGDRFLGAEPMRVLGLAPLVLGQGHAAKARFVRAQELAKAQNAPTGQRQAIEANLRKAEAALSL